MIIIKIIRQKHTNFALCGDQTNDITSDWWYHYTTSTSSHSSFVALNHI
jgi:hypothetical protein